MLREEVRAAIEAVLFAHGEPVAAADLARVLELPEDQVRLFLSEMENEYRDNRFGIRMVKTAEGYCLSSKKEYSGLISALNRQPARRLSAAALETLAIIAYRQPVTRMEVESIRGVKVERAIYSLLERGLIQEVGRREGLGRPVLYGTSAEFLRVFGLTSLDELPPLDMKEVLHGQGEVAGGTD